MMSLRSTMLIILTFISDISDVYNRPLSFCRYLAIYHLNVEFSADEMSVKLYCVILQSRQREEAKMCVFS